MNYRWVPGVKYIAGVTFQSEYGTHEAGTVVEEAPSFQNLEVLVDNRFLWPYAPDDGYEYLPPHLFNSVRTQEEVKAELEGDPKGTRRVPRWPTASDDPTEEGDPPQQVEQAEWEAEQQEVIREQIRATQQPGQPKKDSGPTPEEVAAEATGEKTTTRKATPRNRN